MTALDDWLRTHALRFAALDLNRTYVLHGGDGVVAAYFSVIGHEIDREDLPTGKSRRNMPGRIPAVLLAKLAVRSDLQRQGLGAATLIAAMERVIAAAESVGTRYMVVDALNEDVARFYERFDFKRIPNGESNRLAILIDDVRETLSNG